MAIPFTEDGAAMRGVVQLRHGTASNAGGTSCYTGRFLLTNGPKWLGV